MPHAELSHPTRGTLKFRQGQSDEDRLEASGNVTPELGTDRPPLVHIETRERQRSIRGRVTAPRRARNDGTTNDWQQALANYVDLLESHVDEFQGDGYTFTDNIRSESFNAILTGVEWSIKQGVPDEIEFDAGVTVGRGVFEERDISQRNPTVDTSMDVAARVDGNDLPGLREMRVSRSFGHEVNAVYDKTSAENNDVVATEGVRHEITFQGTHTGSNATRAAADAALDALQGSEVTFETRFPGYDLTGFVLRYDSNLEARFGTNSHHFSLQFIEGTKA